MTDQEEKQYIKSIFSKVYLLVDKYNYKKLSDADWEALIQEAGNLGKEFRGCGDDLWHLYRGMITECISYKEKKERKKNGVSIDGNTRSNL